MLGVQIFYLSEIIALANKHTPKLIVGFAEDRTELKADQFNELHRKNIKVLILDIKNQLLS